MTKRVKVVVSVPVKDAKYVRAEIGRLGGGTLGNYSFCSYSVLGKGSFMPNDKAHPYEEPVIDLYPLINIDDYKQSL